MTDPMLEKVNQDREEALSGVKNPTLEEVNEGINKGKVLNEHDVSKIIVTMEAKELTDFYNKLAAVKGSRHIRRNAFKIRKKVAKRIRELTGQ